MLALITARILSRVSVEPPAAQEGQERRMSFELHRRLASACLTASLNPFEQIGAENPWMIADSGRFKFSVGDRSPDRDIAAFAQCGGFLIGINPRRMDGNANDLRIQSWLRHLFVLLRLVVYHLLFPFRL